MENRADYFVRVENMEAHILLEEAYISNDHNYTIFKYADQVIRFKAPYSLEKYIEVKKWDKGYLVVMAKYEHSNEPIEEYIDLMPILENLYIDASSFVNKIKKVRVMYE